MDERTEVKKDWSTANYSCKNLYDLFQNSLYAVQNLVMQHTWMP